MDISKTDGKWIMKRKAAVSALAVALAAGLLYLGFKKNIDLSGMHAFETSHFRIYFSALEDGTKSDIGNALEGAYPGLQRFFMTAPGPKAVVVVYPGVADFQRAYLGHILSVFYGDWAAGAAHGDMVLAASPENPGSEHTYADMLDILVHEHVHTLIRRLNDMPNVWLDEGLAVYLAGQESRLPETLPGFETMQKDDLGVFLDHDGYAVGYAYMAYLDAVYGNEKIIQLIRTNDYPSAFGKSAFEIYTEWVRYMEENPRVSAAPVSRTASPRICSAGTAKCCDMGILSSKRNRSTTKGVKNIFFY
jgi:hypothetical protein